MSRSLQIIPKPKFSSIVLNSQIYSPKHIIKGIPSTNSHFSQTFSKNQIAPSQNKLNSLKHLY